MAEQAALFQEHYLLPTTHDGAIWPLARDYLKPRHFHAQLELLLLLRGRARVRVGRSLYVVHAGQLMWHLPGVEHAIDELSPDCELRIIHVEPDLCASVARERLAHTPGKAEVTPGAGSFAGWSHQLSALVSGRPVVELTQRDQHALLEHCDKTCAEASMTPGEVPTRLRQALAVAWAATTREHDSRRSLSLVELASCQLFDDPGLGRSEVCRALDVSEGYLSRRFQLELGISLSEQRARLRIARFVTHVNRDRQNCLAAALSSGFRSYSQLHRVFGQVVRTSPKSYFRVQTRNARANLMRL